jgi:hypothetical protein
MGAYFSENRIYKKPHAKNASPIVFTPWQNVSNGEDDKNVPAYLKE